MILFRTHRFGASEQAIAATLASGHGEPVVVAADETRAVLPVAGHPKLSVTREACEAMGLFCPKDFTWRNGDYIFYLARKAYPDVRHFWLVEADVEHSFPDFGALLSRFAHREEVDLIAAYLAPATPDWYWYRNGRRRPTGVYRCFFPLVRMSARAVDACLRERRRARYNLHDRLHWPNDEVFVATETVHAGLKVADLNSFGPRLYAEDSFGYDPLDGGAGNFRAAEGRVYHPVLHGDAYAQRIARHDASHRQGLLLRACRKLQRLI